MAIKPPALIPGARVRVVATASPAEDDRLRRGIQELSGLGYRVEQGSTVRARAGYFSGDAALRRSDLLAALNDPGCAAIIGLRGGYGTTYLLDELASALPARPKILMGHSDVTALQVYLWQQRGWVTFYGPMVAAGFEKGANVPGGYDSDSTRHALTETQRGWSLGLRGESLAPGEAEGVLLGGCLTVLRSSIGTPWELDTRGAILLLEDISLKPYQMDRALMHLKQAGKLDAVKGIVLGEFPDWGQGAGQTVPPREVAARILAPLKIPIVWGAAVGHTPRAMLTLPLGVRCRLRASGSGALEFLEPAVTSPEGPASP